MADISHLWRTCAQLQKQLTERTRSDGCERALEAALDELIAHQSVDVIARAMATARRRESHRAGIRARHLTVEPTFNPFDGLHARDCIRRMRRLMANDDWQLLCDVAAGHEYGALARGKETMALRVRVSRLRARFRALAA